MDYKEIALEVAKEVTPEFVWEEGCGHECGVCKHEMYEFAEAFLARVDAERGKKAVAIYKYQPATLSYGVQWLINTPLPNDTPLFLSPTLPEGTVLIRAEPTTEILDYFIGATNARGRFEAMIQAAQEGVTK